MADDFQFSPQERPRNGTNPLLFVALGIALLGAGGWYLLQSTTSTRTVVAPAPVTISRRRTVVSSTSSIGSGTPGALIPTTRLDTALQQAKSTSGKEDPFRTEIVAPPPAIKLAPLPKLKLKLKKLPPIVAAPVPKEFFANGVTVVGIVDTPKENYAIVTYQDRTEIARVGDAIGSAIVKSISARSRTVVFRERGEEITRALEVSQG